VSNVGVNEVLPIFGSDIVPCGAMGVEPQTSCMPCKLGCFLTMPDMAPACDYRAWTGLEEYSGVRRTADLMADLPSQ
jgi:hypothetical protein